MQTPKNKENPSRLLYELPGWMKVIMENPYAPHDIKEKIGKFENCLKQCCEEEKGK